jgi:hypothetical protein
MRVSIVRTSDAKHFFEQRNFTIFNFKKSVSAFGKMKALESSDDRFEAFPDLSNNWIVWDRDQDDFAEVGTLILGSLPESRARAFCSLLNRLFSKSNQSA